MGSLDKSTILFRYTTCCDPVLAMKMDKAPDGDALEKHVSTPAPDMPPE